MAELVESATKRAFSVLHQHVTVSPVLYCSTGFVIAISLLLYKATYGNVDAREPPTIKPRLPVIGHLLGLLRYRTMYFKMIHDKHPQLNVATLPYPGGKAYAAFSPELQRGILRNRNFTTGHKIALTKMFGLENHVVNAIMGQDGVHQDITERILSAQSAALTGEPLKAMQAAALEIIASRLNCIHGNDEQDISNLYLWVRELFGTATSKVLFGPRSPYNDSDLIDAQWTFEGDMQGFIMGILPSIINRQAYKARALLQSALGKWYRAGHDQEKEPSEYIKCRASLLRKQGIEPEEFAKLEIGTMAGATNNTIPSCFWVLVTIFLRPLLVDELRAQALDMLGDHSENRKGVVEIHIGQIDEKCPLLVSCWKEAIRLNSHPISSRSVIRDTMIRDPDTGNEYLFKKGRVIMLPATVLHRMISVWGDDADEFNARRFMSQANEAEKRGAYMPFGAGKHMCPGRHFAFAEHLGFMTALLLGYEIEGLKKENVRPDIIRLGEAISKPALGGQGGHVVLRRRKGWEDVQWKFVV
ncbi:cytochrome P450 [Sporormia fimetaria CBS 119925]|uniref:Cytochrome P450 n=1 Tax=Sporormia fimetaria CBS 119925 TaxID=1340428 RepID=A0A6A6V4T1_9PLEO|nr:cytochrome P450 [Sporormia fimetaria CBS 119925]